MKIGVFTRYFPPDYSGAGQQALRLTKALGDEGIRVDLLTPKRNSRFPDFEERSHVKVRRVRGNWSSNRWSILKLSLVQFLSVWRNKRNWDSIIYFSIGNEVYIPLVLAYILRIPVVLRVSLLHSDDLESLRKVRFGQIRLWILSLASVVICPSKEILEVCEKALKTVGRSKMPRCVLIPNGIDTDHFAPCKKGYLDNLRFQLNLPKKALIGVFLGFIHPRKNVDRLIREWAIVHREFKNTKLLLIGPRPTSVNKSNDNLEFLLELDKLALKLRLSEVVSWIEVEDVRPFLQCSDLFLFASQHEGFPNALLEAMSTGLPCFVVERDWLPTNLIIDEKTGFLAQSTEEELGKKIIKTIKTGNYSHVGAKAREHIKESYSIREIAHCYHRLIFKLLNNSIR